MDLKSLSATALETLIDCPSRFQATHIDRAPDESNDAAGVGLACHGALEIYVREAIINKSESPSWNFLDFCYRQTYPTAFGSLDLTSDTYVDGNTLLKTWHKRTTFDDVEVLLLETKENFLVPIPGREQGLPFNYVFDRLDRLEEDVYRVVDYKTIRANLTYDELRRKLQARVYALAAQIRHKNAKRIYVEFDLLRHEPVGVVFSRDENIATWRLIKSKAQEAFLMVDPPEQLNTNCKYCVRAAGCDTLRRNIAVGGIESIETIPEMVDIRAQLSLQQSGIESLIKDIDARLLGHAQSHDTLEIEGNDMLAEVTASYRRTILDPTRVAEILGPELAKQYNSFRVGDIDRIMKEEPLTPEQRAAITRLIGKGGGEPRIKTRKK